ncbi:MAG TPA: cation diffusion facilitator family transporter [Jatrophihabitans sp.]|nr:cation diffusion facilitator family transporter [Jatrophihabitans sp.]
MNPTPQARPHGGPRRGPHQHGPQVEDGSHADRRWLSAALAVIVAFLVFEVAVGLAVGSLALLTDAGHLLTDAGALAVAIAATGIARRPARGAYTYGFTRIDAVSAQANGILLLLLAAWFSVAAVRRLFDPPDVPGGAVLVVALVGIAVNLLAVLLAARADRSSLNVRGALAHLVTDLWAFVATALAGAVMLLTGWTRADAVASLVVAALMVRSGVGLVRSAGRVFLEAAPNGTDPARIGRSMAGVAGVREVHDLHVWDLGAGEPALSAHLVIETSHDCHEVARGVRQVLSDTHRISHATLQADHQHGDRPLVGDDCTLGGHGPGYVGDAVEPRAVEPRAVEH